MITFIKLNLISYEVKLLSIFRKIQFMFKSSIPLHFINFSLVNTKRKKKEERERLSQ